MLGKLSSSLRLAKAIRRDPCGVVLELMRTRGDVCEFGAGPARYLLVSHPKPAAEVLREKSDAFGKGIGLRDARAFLGDGLLTCEDEDWAPPRRCIQEALGVVAPEELAAVARGFTRDALARTRADTSPLRVSDPYAFMAQITAATMGHFLLGVDIRERFPQIHASFEQMCLHASSGMTNVLRLPAWMPTPRRARARLAAATLVTQLRECASDRVARVHATTMAASMSIGLARVRGLPGDVQSQVATLLFTGYETTACCLAWALLLIGASEATQSDLARADGNGHQVETRSQSRSLRLANLIREALRLYPPVWIIPRVARRQVTVGGIVVRPGTSVLVSPLTIHRNPRLWAEPEAFHPDRFSNGAGAADHGGAFVPFGIGQRACVAGNIAVAEAHAVLDEILGSYSVAAPPRDEWSCVALLTLRPQPQSPVVLAARESTHTVEPSRVKQVGGSKAVDTVAPPSHDPAGHPR